MKCPKCGRDTYTKKWDDCSAEGCSLNRANPRAPIPVTAERVSVTVSPKRGRPKKEGALSNAERQRAYRERKKSGAVS